MQLTHEAKKILARTASEAAAMQDDWIGTDHLLLGILCEPTCLAAQHLAQAGITLTDARTIVVESKSSRPGPGSAWLGGLSPLQRLLLKWRKWRYRARG